MPTTLSSPSRPNVPCLAASPPPGQVRPATSIDSAACVRPLTPCCAAAFQTALTAAVALPTKAAVLAQLGICAAKLPPYLVAGDKAVRPTTVHCIAVFITSPLGG